MPKAADVAAHALWSGTISFGLVSIPVYLHAAHRSGGVHARMLDRDGTPLKRRFYCEIDGVQVDREEIARGIEGPDGQSILVSDDELEALSPRKSRDIDLRLFTKIEHISTLLYERSYFLFPGGESSKAYRLLGIALSKLGVAGIATFVMREKEYLVAIVADRGMLRADSLRFADEVRAPKDVGLTSTAAGSVQRIAEMSKAIESRTAKRVLPEMLRDAFAERVRAALRSKINRRKDVIEITQGEAELDSEAPDLLEILRRSLKSGNRNPIVRKKKITAAQGGSRRRLRSAG